MARQKSVHIRMKPAMDSDLFCGMDKSPRFTIGKSVGPKAKGGTCGKCIRNRDLAVEGKG